MNETKKELKLPFKFKIKSFDLFLYSAFLLALSLVWGLGGFHGVVDIYVVGLMALFSAILLHELGHVYAFKKFFGKKVDGAYFVINKWNNFGFETGEDKDYDNLPKEKLFKLYLWGIFFGMIPIVASFFITPIYIVLAVLYFHGCKSDVKEITDNLSELTK